MRDFNASPSSFVYPCWHFPYFLLRPALHHFCDSATKRQNQKQQQQQHLPRRLLRCKHSASHIIFLVFFFFLTHSHLSLLTPKHNQTSSRLANRPVIHSLSWFTIRCDSSKETSLCTRTPSRNRRELEAHSCELLLMLMIEELKLAVHDSTTGNRKIQQAQIFPHHLENISVFFRELRHRAFIQIKMWIIKRHFK